MSFKDEENYLDNLLKNVMEPHPVEPREREKKVVEENSIDNISIDDISFEEPLMVNLEEGLDLAELVSEEPITAVVESMESQIEEPIAEVMETVLEEPALTEEVMEDPHSFRHIQFRQP